MSNVVMNVAEGEGHGSVLVDLIPSARSGVNVECPRGRLFVSEGLALFLPEGEQVPRQVTMPGFHPSIVIGLIGRLLAGVASSREVADARFKLDPPCEEGIHDTIALRVVV